LHEKINDVVERVDACILNLPKLLGCDEYDDEGYESDMEDDIDEYEPETPMESKVYEFNDFKPERKIVKKNYPSKKQKTFY